MTQKLMNETVNALQEYLERVWTFSISHCPSLPASALCPARLTSARCISLAFLPLDFLLGPSMEGTSRRAMSGESEVSALTVQPPFLQAGGGAAAALLFCGLELLPEPPYSLCCSFLSVLLTTPSLGSFRMRCGRGSSQHWVSPRLLPPSLGLPTLTFPMLTAHGFGKPSPCEAHLSSPVPLCHLSLAGVLTECTKAGSI